MAMEIRTKIPKVFLLKALVMCVVVLVLGCNGDDDAPSNNPADALPPATQTGEGTFGCLIDGEPFFPARFGRRTPRAFYQATGDNVFTLGISAGRQDVPSIGFVIEGLDIPAIQETQYQLGSEADGNFNGRFSLDGGLILLSTTTDDNPGRLTITRFENENEFIISGTFAFTVLDNEGNEIRITEGRFDLPFTN